MSPAPGQEGPFGKLAVGTWLLLPLLLSPALRAECLDCIGFSALDASGDPILVIARESAAAAAGDLLGDPADEWISAHVAGGILVREGGLDGAIRIVPGLRARALAVLGGRLYAALDDAGVIELDFEADSSRYVWAHRTMALATVHGAGAGADYLCLLGEDGRALALDPATDAAYPLAGPGGVALAGGDFLGRGHDQLAVLRDGGSLQVLDFFAGDSSVCHAGALALSTSIAGSSGPRGLAPLPSGHLAGFTPEGLLAFDLTSCEVLEVDLSLLEWSVERHFTALSEPASPGGGQIPGDCNQDGALDLSDPVCLLGHLFLGRPPRLPCGNGSLGEASNTVLLDTNGDRTIDLSDPVHVLVFLFSGGGPPVRGTSCVAIEGCPEECRS